MLYKITPWFLPPLLSLPCHPCLLLPTTPASPNIYWFFLCLLIFLPWIPWEAQISNCPVLISEYKTTSDWKGLSQTGIHEPLYPTALGWIPLWGTSHYITEKEILTPTLGTRTTNTGGRTSQISSFHRSFNLPPFQVSSLVGNRANGHFSIDGWGEEEEQECTERLLWAGLWAYPTLCTVSHSSFTPPPPNFLALQRGCPTHRICSIHSAH